MYATFDRHSPVKFDSKIHCLSWKGNARYGWLALGNSANTVGVTYTELNEDVPDSQSNNGDPEVSLEKQGMRRNFNFREHTKEVTIARWNPLLDKIATCDSSGTVIVWRNHNGRSIMELVNNRGSQISDFQWSRDGSKVLITYSDGYVLLGTAFGRRIWARQLNIGTFVTTPTNQAQNSHLLSSTWSPDDSRIVVGSSIGELIELDAYHNGSLVSTTEVLPGIGIIGLEWVRIPGTAESTPATKPLSVNGILQDKPEPKSNVRLSLYLRNGKVVLMNSCGDQQATIIRTGLIDGKMIWCQDGSILAVAGLRKSQGVSTVRFFQPSGQLLFTLPLNTKDPISALTWGHNDYKLFVAASNQLYSVTVDKEIPTLQSICQRAITAALQHKDKSFDLVLPTRMKVGLAQSFTSIIKGHVPKDSLLQYVSRPPPPSHRIYCTLIPSTITSTNNNSSNSSATTTAPAQQSRNTRHHSIKYTLYVEHMGNLIPILEASRRSSKLRPSFTISLPSDETSSDNLPHTPRPHPADTPQDDLDPSDTHNDTPIRCVDGGADNAETHTSINTESGTQLAYKEEESTSDVSKSVPSCSSTVDDHQSTQSPTVSRHIAEVSSHLINSKFRIQSVNRNLPTDMGTITIKTSFLHIQPRKVVVHLPHVEADSGVDTDHGSDSDEPEGTSVFPESELSLNSLSSMEELTDSTTRPVSSSSEPSVAIAKTNHRRSLSSGSNRTINANSNSSNTASNTNDNNLIIHSKTPTWNEQHMIYQLDFGGRVTTKSAKNFQLEMESDQVLQFGRIENGSFILDFQQPFSPIQAFATALANLV